MNAIIQIEQKVKKFSSKVERLADIASLAICIGVLVGGPATFFYGEWPLFISVTAAIIMYFGVVFYASHRKKEYTKEVIDLESKHLLSESEAEKLKKDIKAIFNGPPENA